MNTSEKKHKLLVSQQQERPITLAIVEDDQRIRWGLTSILDEEDGFLCVGKYESAEEALSDLEDRPPQVVLLDINLPGMNGIECAKRLRKLENPPQIIMLTIRQDSEIIFDALAAGASGYLLKPPTADELLSAIRDVSTGGAPMTASIARRVVQSFRQPRSQSAEIESLTPRELEVLDLLSKGYAYKEVAAELGISYSTVQRHIENIYRKLHVHSATHAVSKYLGA
ncbi:MAG: response regulator transcription factor [Verrucomicrobiota bacterium]